MRGFSWAFEEIAALEQGGALRQLEIRPGLSTVCESRAGMVLNFAGNDYLGLGAERVLVDSGCRAAASCGSGSGSSRLLVGNFQLHDELEERLADFLGTEAALVCGSGYLANLACIPSVVGRNDVIISDKYSHASLIDAILLSRAKHLRFRHSDLQHLTEILETLARGRKAGQRLLIVTESLFSMDGDLAPLQEIVALAVKHDAMLLVDEAHAIGVYGRNGRGLCDGLDVDGELLVRTGSFGKSFASYGGFIAAPAVIRDLIINKGRGFIYNTALPPFCAAVALAALDHFADESRRARLFTNIRSLSSRLSSFEIPAEPSPIIPLRVPGNDQCLRFKAHLLTEGILGGAIRSPTVPRGTERIRLSLSAAHTKEDIERAAHAVEAAAREHTSR